MTSQNPSNTSDRSLNRPQHPSQSTLESGATKTPTPEQSALAVSTSVAHGLRTSMNGQVDHIRGLQGAYYQAADNIAEDASDFFAAAISGQYVWGNIAALTQEKLAQLPKSDRVDVAPAQGLLPPPSSKRDGVTQNRYLLSAAPFSDTTTT